MLCIAISLAEIISDTRQLQSPYAILILALQYLSIIALIRMPRLSTVGVFVTWAASNIAPFLMPSSHVFAALAAIMLVGYLRFDISVAIAISYIGGLALVSWTVSDPFHRPERSSLPLLLITLLAFAGFGFALRLTQHQIAEHQRQAELRYRQRLAADLHDIICNDLSYALWDNDAVRSAAAQQATATNATNATKDSIRDALSHTRAIISQLKANDGIGTDASDMPAASLLTLAYTRHRWLERLGYVGTLLAPSPKELEGLRLPVDRHAEAVGLIYELFGNIANHAEPDGGYVVECGITSTALHLAVSDIPRHTDADDTTGNRNGTDAAHRGSSTGTGLRYYQDLVTAAGGTMHWQTDGELWTLTVYYPFHSTRPQRR